ncbi:hypothetical protein EVAR_69173_1 [Eumeta japonica]|uniref:Uncharacterized protein n=1 Tax=Eumeta variegata TaxID=151549 RepID=A0A4C1ZIY4_EUMVA|nr:hypothetical protein EVAR_69173_1 [Eumeta japonica]
MKLLSFACGFAHVNLVFFTRAIWSLVTNDQMAQQCSSRPDRDQEHECPILTQEASNALMAPLGLCIHTGNGDRLFSDGSHASLLLVNTTKKKVLSADRSRDTSAILDLKMAADGVSGRMLFRIILMLVFTVYSTYVEKCFQLIIFLLSRSLSPPICFYKLCISKSTNDRSICLYSFKPLQPLRLLNFTTLAARPRSPDTATLCPKITPPFAGGEGKGHRSSRGVRPLYNSVAVVPPDRSYMLARRWRVRRYGPDLPSIRFSDFVIKCYDRLADSCFAYVHSIDFVVQPIVVSSRGAGQRTAARAFASPRTQLGVHSNWRADLYIDDYRHPFQR